MTRQFRREKQGKNDPILGKIRHCELHYRKDTRKTY